MWIGAQHEAVPELWRLGAHRISHGLACLRAGFSQRGAQAPRYAADPGADPSLAVGQRSPLALRGKVWDHAHAARSSTLFTPRLQTRKARTLRPSIGNPCRHVPPAGLTQADKSQNVTTGHKMSRNVTEMSRKCHDNVTNVTTCHKMSRNVTEMSRKCHKHVTKMSRKCHGNVTEMSRHCHKPGRHNFIFEALGKWACGFVATRDRRSPNFRCHLLVTSRRSVGRGSRGSLKSWPRASDHSVSAGPKCTTAGFTSVSPPEIVGI